MSDPARMAGASLPADLAPPVEAVRHAFAAAWEAGRRPALEEYLRDAPSSARDSLFRELLRAELAYRGRQDEKPTLDEYLRRFPDDADLIGAVFRDTPTAADSPAASAADWPTVPGYAILGRLEPGGMGVVYRARQVALNRTVALKVIRAGAHAGSHERARFRIEAEAVASLAHPHIIPIYDYGECDGTPYLAMEFAEGGSLARRLGGRPTDPAQAAGLVETLARAVQFVHEHGLIHRDLKPANVLLSGEGVPKLADFGLAKRLDVDQGLTRSHAVLGTAGYMAPEQAAGNRHALGPAADIYALGAILYETLTGQPPFWAETYELTIHRVLSEEPLPPTRLRPDVPPELEAICLRCLEKKPERRFASALELAEDLRRYQDGKPVATPALGALEWHARVARRAGYELLERLGSGARGVTYKARHLALKRVVAFRLIAAGPASLPGAAEAAAQLHHPNIVEVYDFGEHDGERYVATEYVEGRSLADDLAGPPKPANRIAELVETLARAVHHAHQRGTVHGDLKPSWVWLAADGSCKVGGFALAHGQRDEPSPATDVCALGAVLYELLSGRPPGPSDVVPEPPRRWRPEVPHGLEAICLRCLEREPARRYPSAAALAEDLRRFRSGEVLFVEDLDDRDGQERWARRAGYEIVEVLGQGRDGFCYKARQLALDRIVVLKRMSAEDRFAPAAKAHFRREAYLLASLRHPNVVQLYDQGEQNDLVYFAREFVAGRSLAERAAEAPLPARAAAELTEALARAVHALHVRGTVHGGLDPADVYVTPAGVPKVTRLRRARPPGNDRRRAGYLAPEQLERGNRGLAAATDVYALGAILFTLLTGQPPAPGPALQETLAPIRAPAPELDAICLTCLEKQPSRRPASAEALADELRRFLKR